MDKVHVGLDLGSSSFQQAAINRDGAVTMNRRFPTSEANLRTAFTGLSYPICSTAFTSSAQRDLDASSVNRHGDE